LNLLDFDLNVQNTKTTASNLAFDWKNST
jgi:hypothetical protein